MDSLKAQLSRYILKRRLDGGEFLYVYRPRGQSVAGKKAVWSILKSDGKIFRKLREASNINNDEDFENLALKTIPVLPYEDSLSPDTNGDTKEEGVYILHGEFYGFIVLHYPISFLTTFL